MPHGVLPNIFIETAVIDFDTKNVPVNSTEQAVLGIIRKDPLATYGDIATKINKTRKTVARAIAELKQRGLIYREGSDKSGSWRVVE